MRKHRGRVPKGEATHTDIIAQGNGHSDRQDRQGSTGMHAGTLAMRWITAVGAAVLVTR
jgi:hypothetical protein